VIANPERGFTHYTGPAGRRTAAPTRRWTASS
jgi:hypothetical protein